jgi:hypothetical protein
MYAFTLNSPVEVCIQRDSARVNPHGEKGARAVFAKVAKVRFGIPVDATSSVEDAVARIRSFLPK